MKKTYKNKHKAYSLLLKLVDKETRKHIRELDKQILALEKKIHKETGWFMTSEGHFRLYDNFQNMHDPEFRTFDTFTVYRGTHGYSITSQKPYNWYFDYLRRTEFEFIQKHEEELKLMAHLLLEKENILIHGSSHLVNPEDYSLCQQICQYLGYTSQEQAKRLTVEI